MLSRPSTGEKAATNINSSNPYNTKLHEFNYRSTFTNTLPDIPYSPKFLSIKNRTVKSRFASYQPTRLELDRRRPMADLDGGVTIDLIDPIVYASCDKTKIKLDEKDAQLLEDESAASLLKIKRSQQHAAAVPFMRRTEYIADFNRFGVGADRQETKVGYNLLKNFNPDDIFYRDKDSQIKSIQKSFEDAKQRVTKHHSKPGVYAVEETPVFPDFENWKYMFTEVLFDHDPSGNNVPDELKELTLSHCMLAGENDFVGHFGPNVETLQRLLEIEEAGEIDKNEKLNYDMIRRYHWNVNNSHDDDSYAFYKKGNTVSYIPLDRKVKLTRDRRAFEQKQIITFECSFRDYNQSELEEHARRMKGLLKPYDEDEDDYDDDEKKSESEEGSDSDRDSVQIATEAERTSQEGKESEETKSDSSTSTASSSSSSSSSDSD